MASREQKIENLLKLIKGEINPDDLKPKRLCMAIGYRSEPIYTINEKEVTKDVFDKAAYIAPEDYGTVVFNISYGNHPLDADDDDLVNEEQEENNE